MAKKNFSDVIGDAKKAATTSGTKIKETAITAGIQVSKTADNVGHWAQGSLEQFKKKKMVQELKAKILAAEADAADQGGEAELQEAKQKDAKVKLDDALRMAVTEYNDAFTTINDNGNGLCVLRTRAVDLILNVEKLVNSIANRPKSFDTDIAEIKIHRMSFTDACEFAKKELEVAKKSVMGAGAGAASAGFSATAGAGSDVGSHDLRHRFYRCCYLYIVWRSGNKRSSCMAGRRRTGRRRWRNVGSKCLPRVGRACWMGGRWSNPAYLNNPFYRQKDETQQREKRGN